ncbi:MAG: restriction endonuclease subunit S [Sulfuricella sp.]
MKLAAYSHYKPSPISWLDQMPKHWDAASLRWMSRRYSGGTPDKGNEAYWEDGEIPWINSGAVNDGYVVEPSALITREAFANSSAKWIPKDALVMALAGQGKTKGMVAQLGIKTTCNQSMAAIIPDHRFAPRYLYWWLIANYQNIRNMAGGEARDGLNLDMLGSIPCPVPPVPEQQTIARFLDAQTARIDTLVAKKRQLIAKLKEKRSALIARTVTRGLPPEAAQAAGLEPNPEVKDSGVEWIGKIPIHWEARRMKNFGDLIAGAGFPHEFQDQEDEELVFYKVGDLANAIDGKTMGDGAHTISRLTARSLRAKVIPAGAVVYAKIGAALLLNRRRVTARNCCIDNNMTAFISKPQCVDTLWAFYWLSTLDFGEFTNPGAIPSLSEGYQAELPFLAPPLAEQKLICSFLDREISALDRLATRVESAIDRLTEYRQALITSAVTGKIDVRETAG